MKHRRLFVSFLPLYILGLLAVVSCPSVSNTVASTGPEESAPVLSDGEGETAMDKIILKFNGQTYTATLTDNPAAEAFAELLRNGPMTVAAHDYGNFEKVGSLGENGGWQNNLCKQYSTQQSNRIKKFLNALDYKNFQWNSCMHSCKCEYGYSTGKY